MQALPITSRKVAQRLPTILAPQRSLGRMNARPADVRHPALSLSRFGECYVTLSVAFRDGQSGDSSEHLREPARLEHIYGSGVSRQLDRLAKVAVEKRPSRSHSGFDECLGDDAPSGVCRKSDVGLPWSFCPQGLHGICRCCAAGRNKTGNQCSDAEKNGNYNECQPIRSPHAIKHST